MKPEDIHVGVDLLLLNKVPCLVIIEEGGDLFTVAYLDIHRRRCEALVSALELSPIPDRPAMRNLEPQLAFGKASAPAL